MERYDYLPLEVGKIMGLSMIPDRHIIGMLIPWDQDGRYIYIVMGEQPWYLVICDFHD